VPDLDSLRTLARRVDDGHAEPPIRQRPAAPSAGSLRSAGPRRYGVDAQRTRSCH
jgi:hypothetical protein